MYKERGGPVLCLLTDVYFHSPLETYNTLSQVIRQDNDYTSDHTGFNEGVMRTVFALTLDGTTVHLDEKDQPGQLMKSPRGSVGTYLDRHWLPAGYRCTLSELSEYQHHLNRRDMIYRVVRKYLGLVVAQEAYEAHITVALPEGGTYDLFSGACAKLGVKAIHIELSKGSSPTHFITASMHLGGLEAVKSEVSTLLQRLKKLGLHPVRYKIEATIHNDRVPLSDQDALERPYSNYFELHTKVTLRDGQDLFSLQEICACFRAHLARSASNKLGENKSQRFVTMRFHNQGRGTAEKVFSSLLNRLVDTGYSPSHVIKEYVLIDTNLDLDAGWADSVQIKHCYSGCELLRRNQCPFQEMTNGSQSEGLTHLQLID